jgi:hypothetical protein
MCSIYYFTAARRDPRLFLEQNIIARVTKMSGTTLELRTYFKIKSPLLRFHAHTTTIPTPALQRAN